MKITAITEQVRNPDRVNVLVDGKYAFSLDIFQLGDLDIKVGRDYSEAEINGLKEESRFGKIYSRAIEYCFSRPHSAREVRDYLYKKTLHRRDKNGDTIEGASKELTERVFCRLVDKGYIDDQKFAKFWVENRMLKRGASLRRLSSELVKKGVSKEIIQEIFADTDRSDKQEIKKIIACKRLKYSDEQKLMAYLARLGFSYDDIREGLEEV